MQRTLCGSGIIQNEVPNSRINQNTVIIGDFNSNAIWDKENKPRSHSCLVRELSEKGLCSAYHEYTRDIQGKEKIPTFFLHKDIEKQYHIDHCFLRSDKIISYAVGEYDDWIDVSDHMLIILDIMD